MPALKFGHRYKALKSGYLFVVEQGVKQSSCSEACYVWWNPGIMYTDTGPTPSPVQFSSVPAEDMSCWQCKQQPQKRYASLLLKEVFKGGWPYRKATELQWHGVICHAVTGIADIEAACLLLSPGLFRYRFLFKMRGNLQTAYTKATLPVKELSPLI